MSVLGAMVPPGTALTLMGAPFAVPASADPAAEPDARYARVSLHWLRVPAHVDVRSFARGSQRIYRQLEPGLPDGTAGTGVLLEVSPLPGFFAGALRRLAGGCPVQYVLLDSPASSEIADGDDDSLVDAEATLASPSKSSWIAVCFQDRVCYDPRAWSVALDGAAQAGSLERSQDWQGFLASVALASGPRVRLLDHAGRPLEHDPNHPTSVQITTGGVTHDVTVGPGFDGDSGVDVVGGAAQMTSGAPASLLASAEAGAGVVGGALDLTDGVRHVLVSDAASWLAPRAPGVVAAGVTPLPAWTKGNTFEPIVDGIAYFERLVPEMRAAMGGGAVELADWAIVKESLQDSTKPWSLLAEDDSTEIVALVNELIDGQASVQVLVNQFLQTTDAELEALRADIAIAVMAAILLLDLFGAVHMFVTDPAGWVALIVGFDLLGSLPDSVLRAALVGVAEPSKSAVEALNGVRPGTAVWTPYPAALADNPLAPDPLTIAGVDVGRVVNNVGVYHHKLAITKAPTGDPVAYVGGIDISPNRLDSPLHRAAVPFHDIQVRLTGPAVDDVVRTYAERATYHGAVAPIQPVADPTTLTGQGPHLVQIGRTCFAPGEGSSTVPFPTAVQGDHTTHATMLKAIAEAREYIYIEDQYFTPEDEVVRALVAAGSDPRRPNLRLVVTIVEDNGQILGAFRRNDVIHAFASSFGDRFRIGTALRRYLDPVPATFGGLGRMVLRAPLAPGDPEMIVGPAERCPAPPFWAFVESELVLVDSVVANGAGTGPAPGAQTSPDDDPNQTWQRVNIQRGPGPTAASPGWGAKPDNHDQDSCVLSVQIPAVYIHAKLLIVDDVFVGVGTTNVNRRSHMHDGEIHAFAIAPSLKRDPGNPALRLRCRVWAEHLGLTPELGLSLLADPLSALAYFDRSWYRGSRWQPIQVQSVSDPPAVAMPFLGSAVTTLLALGADAVVGHLDRDNLWASFVEPTTRNDPNIDPATDKGPLL